jgi:VCBS repeat-containing protein
VTAEAGVLANDTDADNDALTAVLAGDVSRGSLTLNADGSFTYTPNANVHGTDSFSYRASDGSLASDPSTVSVTITAANDAPVCRERSLETDEDTPASVAAACSDVDNG